MLYYASSMTDSPDRGLLVGYSICTQPNECISDVQTGNMACTSHHHPVPGVNLHAHQADTECITQQIDMQIVIAALDYHHTMDMAMSKHGS